MKPNSIQWLNKTQSTNNELRTKASSLDNLSIIAAYDQTAGRGQGDHTWYSSPNTNILCSVLYRFDKLDANKAIIITQVTTLAILDYLHSKGIEARIKWPNDIWVNNKKICGILIENIIENKLIKYSIVGIGLNINESTWPFELPNPVSLKELTSINYSLENELPLLQTNIARRYSQAIVENMQEELDNEFREKLFRL